MNAKMPIKAIFIAGTPERVDTEATISASQVTIMGFPHGKCDFISFVFGIENKQTEMIILLYLKCFFLAFLVIFEDFRCLGCCSWLFKIKGVIGVKMIKEIVEKIDGMIQSTYFFLFVHTIFDCFVHGFNVIVCIDKRIMAETICLILQF